VEPIKEPTLNQLFWPSSFTKTCKFLYGKPKPVTGSFSNGFSSLIFNIRSFDFENVQKARTRGYNRTKELPNTGF
jgi:hypothetical protein